MTPPVLPPVEVLALNHVLENVLNIPTESEVHSAFKEFWIFTIHDLMSLQPHELLNIIYSHSTTDDSGTQHERQCRFPAMLVRNIELLQQWYREAAGTYDIRIWFTLKESAFLNWKQLIFQGTSSTPYDAIPIESTVGKVQDYLPASPMPSDSTTFIQRIKCIPTDSNKFKDNIHSKQWSQYWTAIASSLPHDGMALKPTTPTFHDEPRILDGNFRSDVGETHMPIHSDSDFTGQKDTSSLKLPQFSPKDLPGFTLAREVDEGNTNITKTVQSIVDIDATNHDKFKSLLRVSDGEFGEIINTVKEKHEQQTKNTETTCNFKVIKSHQEPRSSNYEAFTESVSVEREDRSECLKSQDISIKYFSLSVANYMLDSSLLDTHGLKNTKYVTKGHHHINKMIQQTKDTHPQKDKGLFNIIMPTNVTSLRT